jgi:hypothetical protein
MIIKRKIEQILISYSIFRFGEKMAYNVPPIVTVAMFVTNYSKYKTPF